MRHLMRHRTAPAALAVAVFALAPSWAFAGSPAGPTARGGTNAAAELPVRGQSRLSQLTAANGLSLEVFVRLRAPAPLRFAGEEMEPFPSLVLGTGTCELWLEDRNRDGRYDTQTARRSGRATGACRGDVGAFRPTRAESGASEGPFRDCLFQTTRDLRVVCQPTRFGRPLSPGEGGTPWEVVGGWAQGRQALGRPDDLFWTDGALLILDAPSSTIYRVRAADAPEASPETLPETSSETLGPAPSARPQRPTRSRLQEDRPVSAERRKILDDRASLFGREPDAPEAPEKDVADSPDPGERP